MSAQSQRSLHILSLSSSLPLPFSTCVGEKKRPGTIMEAPHQDQRSRSSRPRTIHACAHSGDLLAFQKLLRANPALLNETNPVVRSHCFSALLICKLSVVLIHLLCYHFVTNLDPFLYLLSSSLFNCACWTIFCPWSAFFPPSSLMALKVQLPYNAWGMFISWIKNSKQRLMLSSRGFGVMAEEC